MELSEAQGQQSLEASRKGSDHYSEVSTADEAEGHCRKEMKEKAEPEEYLEATIKKPKKHFETEGERDQFVRQYQMKYKTELCRNWELWGKCKFKDTCSFAHGKDELHRKTHLPSNYKTKPCKQFHAQLHCPYGVRCQFLHAQRDIYDPELDYSVVLRETARLSKLRADLLKDGDEKLRYLQVFDTQRLPVFKSIVN